MSSTTRRRPAASINFVAVHDGFTLADTVSYSHKHNQANGEDNRDGRDGEACHNFGVEGPTSDPAILQTRQRVQRAMLATMLLAQGTPMLAAGDELGRSQQGNNNAWCQDKPLNWLDWDKADKDLMGFCASVLALRSAEPALSQRGWFEHAPTAAPGACAGKHPQAKRCKSPTGIGTTSTHSRAWCCMQPRRMRQRRSDTVSAATPMARLQPPRRTPKLQAPTGRLGAGARLKRDDDTKKPEEATRSLSKTFDAPAHSLIVLRSQHEAAQAKPHLEIAVCAPTQHKPPQAKAKQKTKSQ